MLCPGPQSGFVLRAHSAGALTFSKTPGAAHRDLDGGRQLARIVPCLPPAAVAARVGEGNPVRRTHQHHGVRKFNGAVVQRVSRCIRHESRTRARKDGSPFIFRLRELDDFEPSAGIGANGGANECDRVRRPLKKELRSIAGASILRRREIGCNPVKANAHQIGVLRPAEARLPPRQPLRRHGGKGRQ